MIPRKMKAAFYLVAGPAMQVNGTFYRHFLAPKRGTVKAHLGPGQEKYLPGWINVDANTFTGKCDVWADLRNKLPFRTSTVDAIYSHHMIEHLPCLRSHFEELFRCLKPGGVFRIGGPSGDTAIKKYLEGDTQWFDDFPDNRRSVGGRLENFIFCRQEHLTILTFSYLEELATDAGFQDVRQCQPNTETNYAEFFDKGVLCTEYESAPDCPHTLLIEARKPVHAEARKMNGGAQGRSNADPSGRLDRYV